MAKKKAGQPPSSATDDDAAATSTTSSAIKSTAQLFAAMQSRSSHWYEKERAGIALLEGFQTALNACRDELTAPDDAAANADNQQSLMTALTGLGGNSEMDPLLAEELFAQVKELKHDFDELLQGMYELHHKARHLGMSASITIILRVLCVC